MMEYMPYRHINDIIFRKGENMKFTITAASSYENKEFLNKYGKYIAEYSPKVVKDDFDVERTVIEVNDMQEIWKFTDLAPQGFVLSKKGALEGVKDVDGHIIIYDYWLE